MDVKTSLVTSCCLSFCGVVAFPPPLEPNKYCILSKHPNRPNPGMVDSIRPATRTGPVPDPAMPSHHVVGSLPT